MLNLITSMSLITVLLQGVIAMRGSKYPDPHLLIDSQSAV